MSDPRNLNELPKELVLLIASFCAVPDVLKLAASSRRLREAVNEPTTFRDRLKHFKPSGEPTGWDFAVISRRAGDSTKAWATFARAHELAFDIEARGGTAHAKAPPGEAAILDPTLGSWLPVLFFVKHPVIRFKFAKNYIEERYDDRQDVTVSWAFCHALAVLALGSTKNEHGVGRARMKYSRSQAPLITSYRVLLNLIEDVNTGLGLRRSAWPYREEGEGSHFPLPTVEQIRLAPLDDTYDIPLPFSPLAAQDDWHTGHCLAALQTDYLADGSWQGYYTYQDRSRIHLLDLPMRDIVFQLCHEDLELSGEHCRGFSVKDARDQHGRFNVKGSLLLHEKYCALTGVKTYVNSGVMWHWDCKVLPLGIVGVWGRAANGGAYVNSHGTLWLWKKQWVT